MPKRDPAMLKKVSISLPFGLGSAEWVSDPTERRAAWELYVELVTRVAVEPTKEGEGLLRETLSSLYSLFDSTREVLRRAGPAVGAAANTVGGLALAVLNRGVRPFLTRWHPRLQEWEERRPPNVSARDHDKNWKEKQEFRKNLSALEEELKTYAMALATIAGLSS